MKTLNLNPGTYSPRDPKSSDYYQIHLKREFNKFLSCGVLANGFARFHCGHCQKDKLIAYSCKGRAVCPSCTGRRMADSSKHLVENVIPDVPISHRYNIMILRLNCSYTFLSF
ncbi:MAG: hypothetical protein HN509_16760 [Halobacteriovoraceae bacterium]|nr:hypothetical protein [Halobacteriovoraceae bacterium]MBT5093629.1 hypothetical protein [Halobacteriovoraceae bacterium]